MGIVCALAIEARHLRPGITPASPLESLDDGTLLYLSGMGQDAAAAGARALVGAGAQALVSFGLAGALDPLLCAGDICIPREIRAANVPSIAAAVAWRERLSAALQTRMSKARILEGDLLSYPSVVPTAEAKARLYASTGALAVDMESFAIAEVAAARPLPFLAVRVIVDRAGDPLPRLVMSAADEYGRIRPLALLYGLLRAPRELAGLLRLGGRYRPAARVLAQIARIGGWSRLAFP